MRIGRSRWSLVGIFKSDALPSREIDEAIPDSVPKRPEGASPPEEVPAYSAPPGRTRYERRSANLPHGVEPFKGLGDEQITVDLSDSEPARAEVD